MSEMFKAALVGRVRNGYLQQAANQLGSVRELAKHLGLNYSYLVALVNMRQYPSQNARRSAKWRDIGDKLLVLVNATLDEIFPFELNDLAARPLKFAVIKAVPTVSLQEVTRALLPPAQEVEIFKQELSKTIEQALTTLTPRHAEVLKLRFGIDGNQEHTIEEVGRQIGVSRERARQIEQNALRKLRTPGLLRTLKCYLEE